MIQSIQTKILPRSCSPHTRRTEFDNYIYIDNNIYILSRPACAEVSTWTEKLTGTKHIFSDQQKLSCNSRVKYDNMNIDKLTNFFKEYNPFSNKKYLRNIVTRVVVNENVNADQAGEIGQNVLKLRWLVGLKLIQLEQQKNTTSS